MEYEFKRKMDKKEIVTFLKELSVAIEKGGSINFPRLKDIAIKNPVFSVELEYKEKDYGRKLEIDIQMKDYD